MSYFIILKSLYFTGSRPLWNNKLIVSQKEEADRDLQKALPYLRRAEKAVDSIKPNDIKELRGMSVANDFTRFTMDTINLLFQRGLEPVK
jgi:dynein heavy chain